MLRKFILSERVQVVRGTCLRPDVGVWRHSPAAVRPHTVRTARVLLRVRIIRVLLLLKVRVRQRNVRVLLRKSRKRRAQRVCWDNGDVLERRVAPCHWDKSKYIYIYICT